MKILVAGCNGLLGQNLLRCAPAGTELHGLARHPAARLPGHLASFHSRDITAPETWDFVRATIRPERILNVAAITDVDGCERAPVACSRVNHDAVSLMTGTGIPVVQLSTDYVFDGSSGPYREEDATNPPNAYGRIKLASEALALEGSPAGLVVRTMWVWGEGTGTKKSFPAFVEETLRGGGVVRAVTDQTGNPTCAEGLARAIWALVTGGCSGVYHVAGSTLLSRFDWARHIAESRGLDASRIVAVTTAELGLAAPRPLRSGLVSDKLFRDTGTRLQGIE